MKKSMVFILALTLIFAALPLSALGEGEEKVEEFTASLDYSDKSNWAYFALGEDKKADVFLVCPLVDTRSYMNAVDLNDKLKARFINALDMEKGIYEDVGRIYSPFYRQVSLNGYMLGGREYELALKNAYTDVSAAFRRYLDTENNGRPIILAGFSQGSQMIVEILKEYYGGDSSEAKALRERLVTVFALGYSISEDEAARYPQIVPASGEGDTGTVIMFDCEDGTVDGTLFYPEGKKGVAINPLNWKTDSTRADKSLNRGAVLSTGAAPIPELCGCYIDGSRGALIVTDIDANDYKNSVPIFPDGSLHVWDYLFYFTNLKENLALRTENYFNAQQNKQKENNKVSPFIYLGIAVAAVAAFAVLLVVLSKLTSRGFDRKQAGSGEKKQ